MVKTKSAKLIRILALPLIVTLISSLFVLYSTPVKIEAASTSTLRLYGNAGGGITNYLYNSPYIIPDVPNGASAL